MKKIIILIVVLLVLGGVGFAYSAWQSENDLKEFANDTSNTLASTTQIFTIADIAQHNQKTDCWMTIDGDVLNVTSFVDKHPGGKVIVEGCGKDASNYFHNVPEHMKGMVKRIYQKLIIGKLAS